MLGPASLDPLIGTGEKIAAVKQIIPKLASSDCNVLVIGELVPAKSWALDQKRGRPWNPKMIKQSREKRSDQLRDSDSYGASLAQPKHKA
jgi:lipoate synthase